MSDITHKDLMEKIRQIDNHDISDELKVANIRVLIHKYYINLLHKDNKRPRFSDTWEGV